MSIKKAIKDQIEAVTAASAAGLTVYYGIAPQRASVPYAIANRITGAQYGVDMGGREAWNREVFQIDLYHSDDDALETIRNGIIEAMHGQGPVSWSGVTVHVCLIDDARDLTELEDEGGESGRVRQSLDLTIKYTP